MIEETASAVNGSGNKKTGHAVSNEALTGSCNPVKYSFIADDTAQEYFR
jgi:hypothetical protein